MRQKAFTSMLSIAITLAVGLGCESEIEQLGPEQSLSTQNDLDSDSGLFDQEESCGGDAGVAVEATIIFDGEVPAEAKLWTSFEAPEGGIPPCSMEVLDFSFPASIRFEDVPRDSGWALVATLDMDGGFPPLPEAGDYRGRIEADSLDLSRDAVDLEIVLAPYED